MSADDPAADIPSLRQFAQSRLPAILAAIDSPLMLANLRDIVATDRWNSFDQFHQTNQTLLTAYQSGGAQTQLHTISTGGQRGTGQWIIPHAQDVHDATLDLVAPTAMRVADYRQCPWHITQWSAATPAAGITCELVIIDSEDQITPARLAGKMALSRLNPWTTRGKLVVAGALGLISDLPVEGCPGAVAWAKFGWGGLDLWDAATPLVGLCISAEQGDALRALHQQHDRLVVRARVDVRPYAGSHGVVSALIPGHNPDQEIWAIAHSAEPGALDNASGVAACVAISRALNSLIAAGKLDKPRRSIRFLHGYECYGFFHYLQHVRRLSPPLAGVCIDTIGARPDLCEGQLSWHATAPASATFADEIGATILREALKQNPIYAFNRRPFLSTEDTLVGDPQFGFPCPWLTNHPFKGYHSSADTLEGVDEKGLALCAGAMAGYLCYLASAGTEEALEIAQSQTQRTLAAINSTDSPAKQEALRIAHAASIDRLRQFVWTGDHTTLTRAFDNFDNQIATSATPPACPLQWASFPAKKIRRRKRPLAPTLENVWPAIRSRANPNFPKAALYWADGQRNLAQIADLAALDERIDLAAILNHFALLAELGYVELLDPADFATEEQLLTDLKSLGVAPGMDIMVHSSLGAIGPVQGGPQTVVRALLKSINPGGTLLAPSFNHFDAQIFNPLTTPTTNGAIAQAIWQHPHAQRSLHPSHAVAAIGPRAQWYVADHLQNGAWTTNSPIGRLIETGGHLLSIGVGHNRSTAYHLAEIALNAPCLDTFASNDKIIDAAGHVQSVKGLAWRAEECPVPAEELDILLETAQKRGHIGKARATLIQAIEIYNARKNQLGDRCTRCPVIPSPRGI